MTVINPGVRVSLLAYEASFRRVEVYERAKSSARRVVFVIDEAPYLMGDATSFSFLETAVRHSRPYDLSRFSRRESAARVMRWIRSVGAERYGGRRE